MHPNEIILVYSLRRPVICLVSGKHRLSTCYGLIPPRINFNYNQSLLPVSFFVCYRYNVFLLVVTYLIPMTAMAICYGSMSWELWGQTQIGEVTQRQINSMISKRKVRLILCVVALSIN